ncbi:MAG TPA: thiamine pyrophosphate-binding protein [Bacillales bacterium]|nr:thiamine pyrophosphate-binding protein [Bacillales bacterium]
MATFNELASKEIIAGIEAVKPNHLVFIPCSTIAAVIQHFESREDVHSFPVSREEDGIGIAAGISLGGKTPVVLIQDTGIGNSLLALTAFCTAYHVPMLILVTRRGGMGEINSAVQNFSEPLPRILDNAAIQTFRLDYRVPLHEWSAVIQQAEKYSRDTHRPIIVMFNIKGGAEQ